VYVETPTGHHTSLVQIFNRPSDRVMAGPSQLMLRRIARHPNACTTSTFRISSWSTGPCRDIYNVSWEKIEDLIYIYIYIYIYMQVYTSTDRERGL
jgi:hypothetical protein